MIIIFCGEDSVSARSAYTQAVQKYRNNQCEIITLIPSEVVDITKGMADNMSLFSTQKIFCVENLEKFSFKKSTKAKIDLMYETLVKISTDKTITLLDFEADKQGRQLKLKDLAKVYESKPATSIFKLLEECYPGNKLSFIQSLRTVCTSSDEMFVFVMLFRHIRQLVLVSQEGESIPLPPWQKHKIINQSNKWEKQTLLNFYSGLIKIEINTKTSLDPYGLAKSLEILACHYL